MLNSIMNDQRYTQDMWLGEHHLIIVENFPEKTQNKNNMKSRVLVCTGSQKRVHPKSYQYANGI